MDFFAREEQAKSRTGILVWLFAGAICFIIGTIYILTRLTMYYRYEVTVKDFEAWDPYTFGIIATSVSAVILLGCLWRMWELRGGGSGVANILGATPLDLNTRDPKLRQLINVTEEMSIASGVQVPQIYVLENEDGINACVAGMTHKDSVLIVTRGALDQLNRDELQGVIAHEFSHMLNGDMKLNMQLLGLIFGIICIAEVGRILLRVRSSGKNSGYVPLAGLVLFIIGWIGVFFGYLIQAAVSRQRETLADASAVQFTRNNMGIANALKKIAGYPEQSYLHKATASQCNHFLFGESQKRWFNFWNLFASHPPLDQRIKALDPSFVYDQEKLTAAYLEGQVLQQQQTGAAMAFAGGGVSHASAQSGSGFRSGAAIDGNFALGAVAAAAAMSSVSQEEAPDQTPENSRKLSEQSALEYAGMLKNSLPEQILRSTREPIGACAIVLGLLVSDDEKIKNNQLMALMVKSNQFVYNETMRLLPLVLKLPADVKLPLVSIAIPALRQISKQQYHQFDASMDALIQADGKLDLFEYSLRKVVHSNLDSNFNPVLPPAVRYKKLADVAGEISMVLSALAYLSEDQAEQAFSAGRQALTMSNNQLTLVAKDRCTFAEIDGSLDKLYAASRQVRMAVLNAASAVVRFDGKITSEEQGLVRALADTLGCPMPIKDMVPLAQGAMSN
jgi:Zn-dependent protease with chaperone function